MKQFFRRRVPLLIFLVIMAFIIVLGIYFSVWNPFQERTLTHQTVTTLSDTETCGTTPEICVYQIVNGSSTGTLVVVVESTTTFTEPG